MSVFIVQGIVTKYLGPTNSRPGRIKASAFAGSVIVEYEHGLSIEANHARAAQALATKYKWKGSWYQGGCAGQDSGYYFVNCHDQPAFCTYGEG